MWTGGILAVAGGCVIGVMLNRTGLSRRTQILLCFLLGGPFGTAVSAICLYLRAP